MRIALVGLTHPFRGGIAHYTTLLCHALRKVHDVRFFSLTRQYPKLLFPGTSQKDDSSTALEVENEPCLDSINPWTWFRTGLRVRRYRPDLVLFSWWHPFFAPSFGTVARVAGAFGGGPSCFLCHNVIPHENTLVDRMLLKFAFSSARGFITHSQEDASNLLTLRPEAKVQQNPHPTYDVFSSDEAPSPSAARQALNINANKVALFFGFVRKYKGLDVLLKAMAKLDPSYHLLVVGEFYEEPGKYDALLEALRQRGQLTLIDRYVPNEEIPQFFSAADVVVVPYLSATQSGIVQMAYAFGIPVVATRVGGLPEVVRDGETGFVVPPGDSTALAQAIERVFEDGRPEAFRQAIIKERQRFSWEHMVGTIDTVAAQLAVDQ